MQVEEEIPEKTSQKSSKIEIIQTEVSNPVEKIPDVELIVDGFGHMPIHDKPKKKSGDSDSSDSEAPCTPISDIDIVRRYTWKTKNRMMVQIISYGATITTVSVPDKYGVADDVIAGFDTLEEYMNKKNPYFGATIGRYANFITCSTAVVKPSGRRFMLSRNRGEHHYHGGKQGFDKVNWISYVVGTKVIMSHVSERYHEGYPGSLMTQITFEVTCDNTIMIEMKSTTSEPTFVNLSDSLFFNLGGHHAGPAAMLEHIVTINADKYTPVDNEGIVTGEKKVVGGTLFDFRVPRVLSAIMPRVPMSGFNHNFCVTRGATQGLTFQARLLHPKSGRVLEVYSNQPGMQFYTGYLLPDPNKIIEDEDSVAPEESSDEEEARGECDGDKVRKGKRVAYEPLKGKGGTEYKKNGLICIMPQNFPDAINISNFPCPILNPGEEYTHNIHYKFGLLLGKYV